MKVPLWRAVDLPARTLTTLLLTALGHMSTGAQSTTFDTAHPADASARVPAPVYRSVFTQPAGPVADEPVDWRQANAAVGQFPRGHVDILRWEAEAARSVPRTAPADTHRHPEGRP